MSSSCTHCRQINWAGLLPPTVEQMDDIVSGKSWNGVRKIAESQNPIERVSLGSLLRMQRDSATCPFCCLFTKIVKRQGAVYTDEEGEKSLVTEDVFFRADPDMCYYSYVMPAGSARDPAFIWKRLSLTAHHVNDPDWSLVYLDNIFQLTDIGTLISPARTYETQPHRTIQGLLFGGRQRSRTLDVELLRSWISNMFSST